jgi:CTP synthase
MEEQKGIIQKGGTMRPWSLSLQNYSQFRIEELYNQSEISERHRHRYEFTTQYRELMSEKGLVLSGVAPDNSLVAGN